MLQDFSIADGGFELQTMWPSECGTESPQLFATNVIRRNANPTDVDVLWRPSWIWMVIGDWDGAYDEISFHVIGGLEMVR